MELPQTSEKCRIQLLPARRISWSGRLGFLVDGMEIWPTIERKSYRIFASFSWPDRSVWRLEYGDESVEPSLWRDDTLVARRNLAYLSGLAPTVDWMPAEGSGYDDFRVRDGFRWRGRTTEYISRSDVKFAELKWRWWWHDIYLDYNPQFAHMRPLVCADLVTHLWFTTPY